MSEAEAAEYNVHGQLKIRLDPRTYVLKGLAETFQIDALEPATYCNLH